jgi:hypothetical protein
MRARGEAHPRAKLTAREVAWARRVYVPASWTWGASALARRLGVNPKTVRRAVEKKTWRHVPEGQP